MGSGSFVISSVSGSGPYTLTIDSSSGMTVLDHMMSQLSDDADALWKITTITDATTIIVTDNLTEGNGGSAYGAPVAGAGYYQTPGTGLGVTLGPEGATGWRALVLRNAELLDDLLTETGTQALTLGAIGDGEIVQRSGTTLAGIAGYVVAQIVQDSVTADTDCGTAFVDDDTIPLITEGTAVFSQAITPKDASSVLIVDMLVWASGVRVGIGIFDNGNTFVGGGWAGQSVDTSFNTIKASYKVAAGGTTALTFKGRVGTIGAGTAYVNSDSGTTKWGSNIVSYLRITEYRPLGSP